MAEFDKPYTTYYQSAIVIIALSCIISKIKRDTARKSQFFVCLHLTPPSGGPHRNTVIPFGVEILEWLGYPTAKNVG